MINPNQQKTETILVTGGGGYIGSAIVQYLLDAGHSVVVYDDFSAGQRDKIAAKAIVYEGDMLDLAVLEAVFAAHEFSTVIHCAAKKVLAESESEPTKYFRNNLVGTLNLLDCMDRYQVPKLMFSSTAAVYAPTNEPAKETDSTDPQGVYGRSKLMAERLIQEYARLGKISSYVIFRYFTVAGDAGLKYQEGAAWKGVFTLIGRAYSEGEPFYLTGTDYDTRDGTGLRDYLHLKDLARAHVEALAYDGQAILNLGTSYGYTVREVVAMFEEKTGRSLEAKEAPRRAGDVPIMLADVGCANDVLGWSAKETLASMVEDTIAVYNL